MAQRRLQLLAGIILIADLADLRSPWSPHFSLCSHSEEAHCATHIKSPESPTMAHLGNHPGEFSEYLPRWLLLMKGEIMRRSDSSSSR